MYNIRSSKHELIGQVGKITGARIIRDSSYAMRLMNTREHGIVSVHCFNEAFAWGTEEFKIQFNEGYYIVYTGD